jgi:tetratricopeptide (TPR) repeat protein
MSLLAGVWKEIGNDAMFMACAERCLELAPDRPNPRFDIAHKYSALDMEANALFHYQQYVAATDNASGWNNLGVSAAQLKLPISAIDAYKRADQAGNSRATSNIAFAQLDAGFLEEALSVCQDGMKKPEPDSRLTEALARCQRAREDEEQKMIGLLEETAPRRTFLRRTGHASIQPAPDVLPRSWQGPKCTLKVTRNGSLLVLTGSYAQKKSGLASMLFPSDRDKNDVETFTVQYTGKLVGAAFVGKFTSALVRERSQLASSLLTADDGKDFVAFLDPDHQTIELLIGNDRHALTAIRESEEEPPEST